MTCTNCRSMALATVALIGLPAFAQETQGQSLPNPQTAALMERIEQLEADAVIHHFDELVPLLERWPG